MTAVIRYSAITNYTGIILNSARADNGDEFAAQWIVRYFSAADIGTNAGQTRDETNPSTGCLVAEFSGSRIYDIPVYNIGGTATLYGTQYYGRVWGSCYYRVSYNPHNGISSIYILDNGQQPSISTNSWLVMLVLIGDSDYLTPLG